MMKFPLPQKKFKRHAMNNPKYAMRLECIHAAY